MQGSRSNESQNETGLGPECVFAFSYNSLNYRAV